MPGGTRRSSGWIRVQGANPTLGLYTEDPAVRVPYHFGLGVNDSGRLSTASRNGATLEFPDAYSFGEAIELRYRFAETGNAQRQGIFMQVRSDVANTSTIRGMEIEARQGAAVALGGLEGMHVNANIASSSTGDITTVKGISANVSMDDTYTGTVTNLYGLHVKIQSEDGSTVTTGYGVYVENEAVTSGEKLTAVLGAASTGAANLFDTVIDSTGVLTTVANTDQVLLWKFRNDAGTAIYMRYDQSGGALVFATS